MRLLVLLLLLPLSALAQSPLDSVEHKLIVTQEQMTDALRSIDELLPSANNPAVAKMIFERMAEVHQLQARQIELGQLLASFAREGVQEVRVLEPRPRVVIEQPPPVVVIEAPPQDLGPQPVSSSDLARIRNAMDEEAFGKGKREVLRSASRDRWFLVQQALGLIEQFSFDEDKVETLAMLHPKILDRENWYLVYAELTFSSSKDDLKRRVGDR